MEKAPLLSSFPAVIVVLGNLILGLSLAILYGIPHGRESMLSISMSQHLSLLFLMTLLRLAFAVLQRFFYIFLRASLSPKPCKASPAGYTLVTEDADFLGQPIFFSSSGVGDSNYDPLQPTAGLHYPFV